MSATEFDEEDDKAPIENAFSEAHLYIKKVQRLLENQLVRVKKEKEAFNSVAKKLKHVHFSSTVKLNVGGQIFTTSLQTLTKDAGSMLHAMFSGRFDTKAAEDGSYFIDRDGTCFRYILNYLRTGKLLLPDDKLVQKEVLEEARFYQIQGIVDELDPPKPVHYNESKILAPDQAKWLISINNISKSNLLYRASRDGWSSSHFHAKCDSFNGPTMVVIKSTGEYIFGGYTEQNWAGSGNYKTDNSAFLFSIVNPAGIPPIQIKVFQNPQNAIYCNSDYGPTFGGNHDLYICNNPNSNNCIVNIGHSYSLPGQSSYFLTGNQNFYVAEMEVYGLQK